MTNSSNNSKANIILILISVVSIITAAFSGVGYTLSKSDFANEVAIEKQRSTKNEKEKKVELIDKQDQIDMLKAKISAAESNSITETPNQKINKDAPTVINSFVSTIISNRSAKEIRHDLKGIAALNVIQQMAPENVNEKYDNPGKQSTKKVDTIKIYKNNDADSNEYYVVYNYSIGDQKLKTRLAVRLSNQSGKTVIDKAQYDMQNTVSKDN